MLTSDCPVAAVSPKTFTLIARLYRQRVIKVRALMLEGTSVLDNDREETTDMRNTRAHTRSDGNDACTRAGNDDNNACTGTHSDDDDACTER